MRERLFTIALAVGLLVGLMGAPASADINDTGTFEGVAEVGKTFWSENDCDKSGNAVVVGEGLYLPGTAEDTQRARQGAWHIATQATGVNLGLVDFEACGWLGPHDGTADSGNRSSGLGPACGASKGHHGMGEVRNAAGNPILKLMDLGWKEAVGGVLPVTGKYQQYHSQQGHKLNKFGTVAAQVNAQPTGGPEVCLTSPGAQSFDVTGTFQLVNTMDRKPKQPDKEPLFPKECKETDPNTDKVKDQDPGSDADFKRPCPTARKSL